MWVENLPAAKERLRRPERGRVAASGKIARGKLPGQTAACPGVNEETGQ